MMLQLKYNGTNVSRYLSSHENSCPFSLAFCLSTLDLFQHSLAYATDYGYLSWFIFLHMTCCHPTTCSPFHIPYCIIYIYQFLLSFKKTIDQIYFIATHAFNSPLNIINMDLNRDTRKSTTMGHLNILTRRAALSKPETARQHSSMVPDVSVLLRCLIGVPC